MDGEEARAVLKIPAKGVSDVQVEAWCERRDGLHCADGTAALGDPGVATALSSRKLDRYPSEDLRILAGVKKGDVLPPVSAVVTSEDVQHQSARNPDPLPWLVGPSPWGGPIVSLRSAIAMITGGNHSSLRELLRDQSTGGLWGALELKLLQGPIMVGATYSTIGTVIYVGTSPRTEYVWIDYVLKDNRGMHIAEVRAQTRWMKSASLLYPEEI